MVPGLRQMRAAMTGGLKPQPLTVNLRHSLGAGVGQGRAGQQFVGPAILARPRIVVGPARTAWQTLHQVDGKRRQDGGRGRGLCGMPRVIHIAKDQPHGLRGIVKAAFDQAAGCLCLQFAHGKSRAGLGVGGFEMHREQG